MLQEAPLLTPKHITGKKQQQPKHAPCTYNASSVVRMGLRLHISSGAESTQGEGQLLLLHAQAHLHAFPPPKAESVTGTRVSTEQIVPLNPLSS